MFTGLNAGHELSSMPIDTIREEIESDQLDDFLLIINRNKWSKFSMPIACKQKLKLSFIV